MCRSFVEPAEITYDREFFKVKYWVVKYMKLKKWNSTWFHIHENEADEGYKKYMQQSFYF